MLPLRLLLQTTRDACLDLSPLVRAIYTSLHSHTASTISLKDDKSYFTVADGLVQHLLTRELFTAPLVTGVVGEEDATVRFDEGRQVWRVDELELPKEVAEMLDTVRGKLVQRRKDAIAAHSSSSGGSSSDGSSSGGSSDIGGLSSLTAFIDPIDGTREFSTGLGEQCTICVGFANQYGRAVGGVVLRPIPDPPTWAMGARSEAFYETNLQIVDPPVSNGFLTTNGNISPWIAELMASLGFRRVPSGGAGNKMLMLLEHAGTCYIQDRGVSRWDTCAAEAILDASGGMLCQLHPVVQAATGGKVEKKEEEEEKEKKETGVEEGFHPVRYTYRLSELNQDFLPGVSALTRYNGLDPSKVGSGARATAVSDVKPYSNLMGLFALAAGTPHSKYLEAIAKCKQTPEFD